MGIKRRYKDVCTRIRAKRPRKLCTRIAGIAALCLVPGVCAGQQFEVQTNDGLTLRVSPGGSVTSVTIDSAEIAGTPAPLFVLRDLSEAAGRFEPNRLANPGYENGLLHWHELQNDGAEGHLVTGHVRSGSAALELSGGTEHKAGWTLWAADPVAVTPGERLRVAAWWKSPAGFLVEDSGTAPALQMVQWRASSHHTGLYVQWLDPTGTPLAHAELAVPLHMNCSAWRLTRRELVVPAGVAAVRLMIGARLLGETVRVDDLSVVPALEPQLAVSASVTRCPDLENCLELASPDMGGLRVTARLAAFETDIAIDGTVADATGTPRAFDLGVQVPVEASDGLTWWDDAHVSRTITPPATYEHAISAVASGWLPISLYPYGGVGNASTGVGLAVALPPGMPQLGEISYDAARGVLTVTFHIGISPLAVRLAGRADFHAVIFRAGPAWGFRDIIQRYRNLFPSFVTPHVWLYGFTGRSQGDFHTPAGVQKALKDDATHVYSAQYTSSDLVVKVTPAGSPRPVLPDLLNAVDEMAHSADQASKELAEAIRSSAIVDTNGDWALKHVIVPVWDQGWWEGSWIADMNPGIENGKAQWNLRQQIDASFGACDAAGAHLDGVQIDNFMSTALFDLRPEALASAGQTLGYSPNTYQPAVHNASMMWEYLLWLRQHLDERWGTDRGITINFWGVGHPYALAPFIDAFGSEGTIEQDGTGGNWNLEILDYRRAIADRRPYLFTNQTSGFSKEQAELVTGPAILFGIPSSDGPNGHHWDPGAEAEVDRAARLVSTFWAAGWEPLTDARSADPDILIERFGPAAARGAPAAPSGIFFTIYNHGSQAHQATIKIDLDALQLASLPTCNLIDGATGAHIAANRNGTTLNVTTTLAPHEARVLHLLVPFLPRRAFGRVVPASRSPR